MKPPEPLLTWLADARTLPRHSECRRMNGCHISDIACSRDLANQCRLFILWRKVFGCGPGRCTVLACWVNGHIMLQAYTIRVWINQPKMCLCIVPYVSVLCSLVSYRFISFCIVLYRFVSFCIVLHCRLYRGVVGTRQYSFFWSTNAASHWMISWVLIDSMGPQGQLIKCLGLSFPCGWNAAAKWPDVLGGESCHQSAPCALPHACLLDDLFLRCTWQ